MQLKNDYERALALVGLYNNTQVVAPIAVVNGVFRPAPMKLSEAEKLIEERRAQGVQLYFDYLYGRMIKTSLEGELDFRLYDRDNGPGAGELAVLGELTRPGC